MRVLWLPGKQDMQLASFRLRCWYFHQELQRRGVQSTIYRRGPLPEADVAIFQKAYTPQHVQLAHTLKARKVRLLYNLSDIVPAGVANFAGTIQLLALCDHVLVNDYALGEFFVNQHNPHWSVLEDPYDWTLAPAAHFYTPFQPRVFWHGPDKNYRLFVLPLQKNLIFTPEIVTEKTKPKWDLALFPNYVKPFEIGFAPLPLENPNILGKSSNKIVGYMALGLSVIASDHPAYRRIIQHGENGFLGVSTDDFNAAYTELCEPGRRRRVAEAGYETVVNRFSVTTLTDNLFDILKSL